MGKIQKSYVYDAYWYFASERMSIYCKRLNGEMWPWTSDEILKNYKFTNAYRVLDRVSQYLIREIILPDEVGGLSINEKVFRILLFKTFNKIDTWELLKKSLGEISLKSYDYYKYDKVLERALVQHDRIYSGAYIMASGKSCFGYNEKHRNHLRLLEFMMKDDIAKKIQMSISMQEVFELLKKYPTIGDFLAYQYAVDINYSAITNYSEMDFVKAGPGAKDGIRKCFTSTEGYSEEDLIKYVAERQDYEFERLGLKFHKIVGRKLSLIDCQNIFCEIDKYSRIAFPECVGVSGRKRIKQKYKKIEKIYCPVFPSKWGVLQPNC
jgi:hypothetical protein